METALVICSITWMNLATGLPRIPCRWMFVNVLMSPSVSSFVHGFIDFNDLLPLAINNECTPKDSLVYYLKMDLTHDHSWAKRIEFLYHKLHRLFSLFFRLSALFTWSFVCYFMSTHLSPLLLTNVLSWSEKERLRSHCQTSISARKL